MALRLKMQRDGKTLRPYWYGAYVEDGRQKVVTLPVKWLGTPPASGRVGDVGDDVFEASRKIAEAELGRFIEESKRKGRAESLTERLIESKTGKTVEYARLDELPERWRSIGRENSPTEHYLKSRDAHFRRFIDFMGVRNPKAVYLYQVTEADAGAFVASCRASLAPRTARDGMQILNTAFARFLPVGASNPFGNLMGRRGTGTEDSIHRKPFTPDELHALFNAARNDVFMFPLIVCAAMTGMRRGDVCKLKWSAVDLTAGMLQVKTAKTGASAEIPIFPMLRNVLEAAEGKGKGYVFPDAAKMLDANPDGLTWRFKKLLVLALQGETATPLPDRVPAKQIAPEAEAMIRANVPAGPRQDRMLDVLHRYVEGQSFRDIEKDTGIVRATLSYDLRLVESWAGMRFVRSTTEGTGIKQRIGQLTRTEREHGQKAASVRDWHALRVTWVTLALSAGVPMELVRRVTGHATVDVVLKHYFRPDREQFKAALNGLLPDVLTGGGRAKQLSAGDELAALAAKVQAGSATAADKKRLRLLAAKV